MRRMLVKYVGDEKETWDECLNSCTFAYNTSKHESSLFSPFEVMFGRKAVIPVELEYDKDGSQLLEEYQEEPIVSVTVKIVTVPHFCLHILCIIG